MQNLHVYMMCAPLSHGCVAVSRPNDGSRFECGDAVVQMVRREVCIAKRHLDIAVAGQGGNFRQRHASLNQSANEGMA